MRLFDERGAEVPIGREVARAGEAVIHEVASQSNLLAKVYHQPRDKVMVDKLTLLSRLDNPSLRKVAALPQVVLLDGSRQLRGFVMPRCVGKEIHCLYGPQDRQIEFPDAAWHFLVHVARNCAAAFETLHEAGLVMADVNEKNLLVSSDGLVHLIDCDSYQLELNGIRHLCGVGVAPWTAPELQDRIHTRGFHGLVRTANHDRFGLSVLIFQLLFMGRHPYAGVPLGGQDIEMADAIRRYLFAYDPDTRNQVLRPPPHTFPIRALPTGIVRLFSRAFLRGSDKDGVRPTGREWADALDALILARKECPHDPGHVYWNGVAECPWCSIVGGGGPNFFMSASIRRGGGSHIADVTEYWSTLVRIFHSDLVRVGVPEVPAPQVAGRPMPVPKPVPPRLNAPISPGELVLPQPPKVEWSDPPPGPPDFTPPAFVFDLPFSREDRFARGGVVTFAITLPLLMISLVLGFGWGLVIFGLSTLASLYVWISYADDASARRAILRVQARQRYDEICRQGQLEHAKRMDEYASRIREHNKAWALAQEQASARHKLDCEAARAAHAQKQANFESLRTVYERVNKRYLDELAVWDAERKRRETALQRIQEELSRVRNAAAASVAVFRRIVEERKPALVAAHLALEKAASDERSEMARLESRKREVQLNQFLATKIIKVSAIDSLRQIDVETLRAHGIGCALDITPRMPKVAGIGEVRRRALQAWRKNCENLFQYNANTPLPQAEVRAIQLKYAQIRHPAAVALRGGAGALSAAETQALRTLSMLTPQLTDLVAQNAQAEADLFQATR